MSPIEASISARYELPFGQGKRWLRSASGGIEDKLVSGWQLNGIATFLSGFPFTPLVGSNRSGDGDTRNPDRPSLNRAFQGPIILGQPNRMVQSECVCCCRRSGTFGNLGRGALNGPGLADVDFSLFKNTALTESTNLEFRAEFFNMLQSRELWAAEHDRILERDGQRLGGTDHHAGDQSPADSIWTEADFLDSLATTEPRSGGGYSGSLAFC